MLPPLEEIIGRQGCLLPEILLIELQVPEASLEQNSGTSVVSPIPNDFDEQDGGANIGRNL